MLTGHGGYLMQYHRLDEQEKLKMYLDLEPELLVWNSSAKDEEIKNLREANNTISNLKAQMDAMQYEMDRMKLSKEHYQTTA